MYLHDSAQSFLFRRLADPQFIVSVSEAKLLRLAQPPSSLCCSFDRTRFLVQFLSTTTLITVRKWHRKASNPEAVDDQPRKDWLWAASIACTITVISTAALITSVEAEVYSPLERLSSVVSYLGAPGALSGVVLALLTTGSYGTRGTFILTIAALVNLMFYTLAVLGAIRLFRAVGGRVNRR
jgi:hypothetical protein